MYPSLQAPNSSQGTVGLKNALHSLQLANFCQEQVRPWSMQRGRLSIYCEHSIKEMSLFWRFCGWRIQGKIKRCNKETSILVRPNIHLLPMLTANGFCKLPCRQGFSCIVHPWPIPCIWGRNLHNNLDHWPPLLLLVHENTSLEIQTMETDFEVHDIDVINEKTIIAKEIKAVLSKLSSSCLFIYGLWSTSSNAAAMTWYYPLILFACELLNLYEPSTEKQENE